MPRIYRLYVDESGDHGFRHLDDVSRRYLGLTGVVIDGEAYQSTFHPTLEQLKQRHFPYDPDDPIILHREDILHRRGAFGGLADAQKEAAFNVDFLAFLTQQEYLLITVVIDKRTHEERYGAAAWHPYHYSLSLLLERYCGYLHVVKGRGDIMAESRGGKEDMELKRVYQEVHSQGTRHHSADFFQQVLTSKELKVKPKSHNIVGLQVADLVAYPIKQEILIEERQVQIALSPFGQQLSQAIRLKHNRRESTGQVKGYGKVFLK